jgi:hypothetical protein
LRKRNCHEIEKQFCGSSILVREQALAIDRAMYGDNHPSMARDLNNLGSAYFCVGRKAEGEVVFSAGARHIQSLFRAGAS